MGDFTDYPKPESAKSMPSCKRSAVTLESAVSDEQKTVNFNMPNNADRSVSKKSSSVANADSHETLLGGLFGTKTDILLLGAGAFLLFINIVVFFGIGSNWLFYLNMRHWGVSIHLSVALWAIVLWLAAESTDAFEDYLPTIRMLTAIGVLLAIAFALQGFFSASSPTPTKNSFWHSAFVVVAVFCAVRSLFLLYGYWYEEGENIEMEETQWFWGMSGFLVGTLIILGLMSVIYVKAPGAPGADIRYEQLYESTRNALQVLIRQGHGSFVLRALAFLIFTGSIAFVYVAGKWTLILLARIRGE